MQRDRNDAVTISILLPAQSGNSEGKAFVSPPPEDRYPSSFSYSRAVRRFTHADIAQAKQAETSNQADLKGVFQLVEFLRANSSGDPVAERNAYEKFVKRRREMGWILLRKYTEQRDAVKEAKESIQRHVISSVDSVRFVLWEWKGKLAPGLFCPDISTALLVHAIMAALGTKAKANVGLRLCPKCGRPFLQRRKDQFYCSIRCREAHRVERWRARQKRSTRSAKRGGKK